MFLWFVLPVSSFDEKEFCFDCQSFVFLKQLRSAADKQMHFTKIINVDA